MRVGLRARRSQPAQDPGLRQVALGHSRGSCRRSKRSHSSPTSVRFRPVLALSVLLGTASPALGDTLSGGSSLLRTRKLPDRMAVIWPSGGSAGEARGPRRTRPTHPSPATPGPSIPLARWSRSAPTPDVTPGRADYPPRRRLSTPALNSPRAAERERDWPHREALNSAGEARRADLAQLLTHRIAKGEVAEHLAPGPRRIGRHPLLGGLR